MGLVGSRSVQLWPTLTAACLAVAPLNILSLLFICLHLDPRLGVV